MNACLTVIWKAIEVLAIYKHSQSFANHDALRRRLVWRREWRNSFPHSHLVEIEKEHQQRSQQRTPKKSKPWLKLKMVRFAKVPYIRTEFIKKKCMQMFSEFDKSLLFFKQNYAVFVCLIRRKHNFKWFRKLYIFVVTCSFLIIA